jgi:hypothetical protein
MITCTQCNIAQPEYQFYKSNLHYRSGHSYTCKTCAKKYYHANKDKIKQEQRVKKQNDPLKYMLYNAKQRAKQKGLEFNLEVTDLVKNTHCPIFGIELVYGGTGKTEKGYGAFENAASLDRIDPTKGYIKGNVVIVCWEANRAKAYLSIDKIMKLAKFYSDML